MTSLPYNIQEADFKKSTETRPYLHNNFSEVDYDEDVKEVVLKIDSNDRNIDKYNDPFSFRVRFNQTESNFDAFGNAGPIVLSKYDNIKYIKLVEAIIPKSNIVQEYVNYNKTLYNNSKIHCYSILKVQYTATAPAPAPATAQKQLNLKLNSGDQIKMNGTIYTVDRHITMNNNDYLQLKERFGPATASTINYINVRLPGLVSAIKGQNTLTGIGTEFTKLRGSYKIKIGSVEYSLTGAPISDTSLTVIGTFSEEVKNQEVYLVSGTARDSTNGANILKGIDITDKKNINFQQNTNISDDTITAIDDIILFNYPNGLQSADKIDTALTATASSLLIKSDLDYPINDQKFLVLPKDNFDTIPGELYYNKTSKILSGLNVNFKLYNIGSIIYLDNGNVTEYAILKITQIISESEIQFEILKDGTLASTITTVQLIYNYSYVRSEEEFSDERFILTNIKEFNNSTYEGTNENSSKAFGILFPSGTTKGHAYMSGISHKLYNRRNLQNLNSLTISFNDSYGNQLKLNNLDSSVDKNDLRHPLNKDNQVHLTFRIGLVENRFD